MSGTDFEKWLNAGSIECWRYAAQTGGGGQRWRHRAQEDEVWLWLNLSGEGLLWGSHERLVLKPGMYALLGCQAGEDWSCMRYPGQQRLEVLRLPRTWLQHRFGAKREHLHPSLSEWLDRGGPLGFSGLMTLWENELTGLLARLDEEDPRSALHAEAGVIEWTAVRLFRRNRADAGATFCGNLRQQTTVTRALGSLGERFAEPLQLTALAREVGCAPHHLSRRVRLETGLTLQRHLRRIRIEAARELLESGRCNVTEAALEVGYQSLSHFAKAFREETGEAPQAWLAQRVKAAG